MAAKKQKLTAASTASPRRNRRREAVLGFEALAIEGGLLSPEWLGRVAQLSAGNQSEGDYAVPKGLNLRDEIGRYWRIGQAAWSEFAPALRQPDDKNSTTRATRFLNTLLGECLGFSATLNSVGEVDVDGRTYPIGHAALGGRVPVVIASAGSGLDIGHAVHGEHGRRRSPFGLCQEYLNAQSDALWGLVSDGKSLRVVRDNASLTRPAWIEVDLERIFSEERFADFAAFWLLVHATRFGNPDAPVSDCPLEGWRNFGREEGTRAREHLRDGVEHALLALGQGFLSHPDNQKLRRALSNGEWSKDAYFAELLHLAYRLIFVLTAEERGVLHPEDSGPDERALYAQGYSLRTLREKALRRSMHDRHHDHWDATLIVFEGLRAGESRLALPALAGIFVADQCPRLETSRIENRFFLQALFRLSWIRDSSGLARVNWRDMGPEELGSVYESLLELTPELHDNGRQFSFRTEDEVEHKRRATGSYYTPDALVQFVVDAVLEPTVRKLVAEHGPEAHQQLLQLTILDPACGSGHFLLAAARRLAGHVARSRAQGTPSAAEYRHALREVVGRCIFGVDLNSMAIELCKVSLWMEAVEPGLPLSFLDSHICHGNALLGATPQMMSSGIPDDAWKPLDGDDRKVASALKKRNKATAKGQRGMETLWAETSTNGPETLSQAVAAVENAPDSDLASLAQKADQWSAVLRSDPYQREKLVADTWCAAFFWDKQPGVLADVAPTNELWRQIRDGQGTAPAQTLTTASAIASEHSIFHWHLGFPQIFACGGFDVVLGNPPWIAHAGRAAQPLPGGVKRFFECNYEAFRDYPTTHGVFVTVAARCLKQGGRLGVVIPSSLSELGGYEPTRRAHDRLCGFAGELTDFGEGQFVGVTQPCMALVSTKQDGGRKDAAFGEPWPMARPDLTELDKALLVRLSGLDTLPSELFGERGIQSDKSLARHFLATAEPVDRFTTPIREGADIREFRVLPPRYHVDEPALTGRLRGAAEFGEVAVLIRQTARYPIAAVSDGLAFRNSLLAGLRHEEWTPFALVALLNSALIRWSHYCRYRDARQPVMPQVKIGHLRAIPVPANGFAEASTARLDELGKALSQTEDPQAETIGRKELDDLVFSLYQLSPAEREAVAGWHEKFGPKSAHSGDDDGTGSSRKASRQRRGKGKKSLQPEAG